LGRSSPPRPPALECRSVLWLLPGQFAAVARDPGWNKTAASCLPKAEASVTRRKVRAPDASPSFGASPRRRRRLWSAEACPPRGHPAFSPAGGMRSVRVERSACASWSGTGQRGGGWVKAEARFRTPQGSPELGAAWVALTLRRVTQASALQRGGTCRCRWRPHLKLGDTIGEIIE
jgi:hypothetical protein